MTAMQTLFVWMLLLAYVLIGVFVSGVAEFCLNIKDIGVLFSAWPILLICVAFAWGFDLGRKVGGKK